MTVQVRADRELGWTRTDTIRTAGAVAVAGVLLGLAWYLSATDGEGLGGSNAALMLLIGAGLGILFERGRYCFFCVFRDLFEKRDSRGMYAILVSIAVGTVGYAVIFSTRIPTPTAENVPTDAHIAPVSLAPVSLALVIAGLAFGLGMVISGGCIAGHLYRLPEGHLRSIPALAGVVLGFAWASSAGTPCIPGSSSERPPPGWLRATSTCSRCCFSSACWWLWESGCFAGTLR